jgi:hypothetical protein
MLYTHDIDFNDLLASGLEYFMISPDPEHTLCGVLFALHGSTRTLLNVQSS